MIPKKIKEIEEILFRWDLPKTKQNRQFNSNLKSAVKEGFNLGKEEARKEELKWLIIQKEGVEAEIDVCKKHELNELTKQSMLIYNLWLFTLKQKINDLSKEKKLLGGKE